MDPVKSNTIRGTLIATLLLTLVFTANVFAQSDGQSQAGNLKMMIEETQQIPIGREKKSNYWSAVPSGIDIPSLRDDYPAFTSDQIWSFVDDPFRNFNEIPNKSGQWAGDINNDGLGDFIMRGSKTYVYFGGSTGIEPDQIIDQWLVPVGDINGDGYDDAVHHWAGLIWLGSETGYQDSGIELASTGIYEFGPVADYGRDRNHIFPAGDLDGDGIDDAIHFIDDQADLNGDGIYATEIAVYWGSDPDSVGHLGQRVNLFDVNGPDLARNFAAFVLNTGDFDDDGNNEIYMFGWDIGNGEDVIRIFDIVDRQTTSIIQDLVVTNGVPLPVNDYGIDVFDINGDSFKEIYLYPSFLHSVEDNYVYTEDAENPGFYGPDDVVIFSGMAVPKGDLNNDGKMDFFVGDPDANNAPYIGYGPDTITNGALTLDTPLNFANEPHWEWQYNTQYPYSVFGDMNGDGVDDFVAGMEFYASKETGFVKVFGNASGDPTIQEARAPISDFRDYIPEMRNVGDVNGDGIDDFALNRFTIRQVDIYFGDETIGETPDVTLDASFEYSTGLTGSIGLDGGDFNNDGFSDVAISSNVGDFVRIFYGGENMDGVADHEIAGSDFKSIDDNHSTFYFVNNVGDVNGDGVEDFMLGSLFGGMPNSNDEYEYYNEAYLFLGGSTLPTAPDATISLADRTLHSIGAGREMAGIGDMNGDGIDDFAVTIANGGNEGRGEIQVFFGNSSVNFNSPDLVLTVPDDALDYIHQLGFDLVGGDFNADGYSDLAAGIGHTSGWAHNDNYNANIFVYLGGENPDEQADRYLKLDPGSIGVESEFVFDVGTLLTIPDFDGNGADELIAFSQWWAPRNAAIFSGNFDDNVEQSSIIRAPNQGFAVGGNYNNALGDFNRDRLFDIVTKNAITGNVDEAHRFEIPRPINISSVEDVPNDQGGKVRVNVNGYFIDGLYEEIAGFDAWTIWIEDGDRWTHLETIPAYSRSTNYVDVVVPRTKPTTGGDSSVDYEFNFKVIAIYDDGSNLAESDIVKGFATDNLAPAAVGGVIAERGADEVELSWDPSASSDLQGYSVFKVDADGETLVGISDETSITVADSEFEGIELFVVKAKDVNNNVSDASSPTPAIFPLDLSYNVAASWNLIGLPLDASDDEVEDLQSKIVPGTLYEYKNSYEPSTQLEPGKGYWAKFPKAAGHVVTGLPIAELELDLKKGWNMISGVGAILAQSGIQDLDNILIPGTLRAFDGGYVEAENLRPGSGYWIRAEKAGTLKFSLLEKTEAKGSVNSYNERLAAFNKAREAMNKIVISDAEGHSQKLYFGSELPDGIDKLSFSQPPAAPGKVFGVGYANSKLTFTEQNQLSVHLQNPEKSALTLKLKLNDQSQYQTYEVQEMRDGIVLTEYLIDSEEPVQLQNSDTEALKISPVGVNGLSADTPQSFQLYSNYPNPFNPATVIRYAVPKTADVALEVYNIAGARVATLVNEPKAAGNHKVTFDASNLSSGIYFVRIQAGAFHKVQKITLIK